MADVSVCNVVQDGVNNVAVSTILSRQLTTQPVPLIVSVVRELFVSVVQLGDQNEPEVDTEVWDNVDLEHGQETKVVSCEQCYFGIA